MTNTDLPVPLAVDGSERLADRLVDADGLLLGLDYDGTLAPIAADPDAAEMSSEVRRRLATLTGHGTTRVVIVSGRALDDLIGRVDVDGLVYAGNHGLELHCDGERTVVPAAERCRPALRRAREDVAAAVDDVPGCRLEDKGVTFTVHVRQVPSDRVGDVRTAVVGRVADVSDVHVTEGKQVFEVRPTVDHDKGATMARFQREAPPDWPTLYLGDDTTDEDAFEAIQPDGVGIHVGGRDQTAAACRIPSRGDVGPFLSWLVTHVLP